MVLICYDGSPDAKEAIERGAELFRGQTATVLAVWEPFSEVVARAPVGFGLVPSLPDWEKIDEASADAAQARADEGVGLARAAGFDAQPKVRAQETTIARAILAVAAELDADAILMGSRGLTGIKSLLLGSVSHEVIQHADRTVVVVPSPQVAAERAAGRR